MKKKRVFIILGVVVLVCASVAFAATRASSTATTTQTQIGQVTQATLSSVVESSGSVSPESEVTLSFSASGTVSKVNVKVGDHVKQGDVLAELDTTDLQLEVAQAEQSYVSQQASYSMTINPDPAEVTAVQLALNNAAAAYQLAQQKYAVNSTDQVAVSCNNLDNAKRTYDDAVTAYNAYLANWRVQVNGSYELSPQKSQLERAKAAYDQALINCNSAKRSATDNSSVQSAYSALVQTKANLDDLINPSELTIATARIQLEQAQASLDAAQQAMENARIIAPFDGVVTEVNAVVGGQGSSTDATIVMDDVSQYHVDVLIDETEIAQLKTGQKVNVTFDALPDAKVTGGVVRIDPSGTVSNGVVNYTVRVKLDPTEAALRTDMTANVSVVIDTHANVLAVPGSAIRSAKQGGYYVNVAQTDGTAKQVTVTTGYTDGDLTEVAGELQVGQRVYISEPATTQQQQQPGFNLFGLRIGG
jgi:HlyD family secretion protein